jgi:hypothetical protein
LENERIATALTEVNDAVSKLTRAYPFLGGVAPFWLVVPRAVRKDPGARKRLARTVAIMRETLESRPDLALAEMEPSAEVEELRRKSLVWYVYDPRIPTEIAERLVAVFRARLVYDLAFEAHKTHAWSLSDVKEAFFDWSELIEEAMGLFASLPGAQVSSISSSKLLDMDEIMARHRQRRERLDQLVAAMPAAPPAFKSVPSPTDSDDNPSRTIVTA